MATAGEPNDEDDKLKYIDREISELLSAKKVLFENMQPFSDELEKIAQRERECIDIRHRLRSEQHVELNEMRQRLSDVQERLTVAEQVTAATQQRALQESDNSEQLELTPEHQPTTPTGSLDKF